MPGAAMTLATEAVFTIARRRRLSAPASRRACPKHTAEIHVDDPTPQFQRVASIPPRWALECPRCSRRYPAGRTGQRMRHHVFARHGSLTSVTMESPSHPGTEVVQAPRGVARHRYRREQPAHLRSRTRWPSQADALAAPVHESRPGAETIVAHGIALGCYPEP